MSIRHTARKVRVNDLWPCPHAKAAMPDGEGSLVIHRAAGEVAEQVETRKSHLKGLKSDLSSLRYCVPQRCCPLVLSSVLEHNASSGTRLPNGVENWARVRREIELR